MRIITLLLLFLMTFPGYAGDEPLSGDQVFQLQAKVIDPNTLQFDWTISPDYFLYQQRFHFSVKGEEASLGQIHYPKAQIKTHPLDGDYAIYRHQAVLTTPFLAYAAGDVILHVAYQGCADSGFCYPPTQKSYVVSVNTSLGATTIQPLVATPKAEQTAALDNDIDRIKHLFNGHSWLFMCLSFFGLGLLLAFTPCVLPMIPVLSGIIIGHGTSITPGKAFRLSLTYVLSMALTYTAIGLLFALLGYNIQSSLQQPWIIALAAGLFVVLALSMFGLYDLALPEHLQARFAKLSQRQSGGHYFNVAIMGCLSLLILSPCVTPPLVGVLGYITDSGHIVLGGMALFSLGLGMGAPLLLISISGGKLLPKAGPWMNTIKSFFGVLLLAVAIVLLDRIIPGHITLFLWASLFVVTSIYMGALQRQRDHALAKLSQGLGIILLVYGIILIIGASLGNQKLWQPLEGLMPINAALKPTQHHQIIKVKTIDDVQQAVKKANGKPVLLDFYADWCVGCKIMERYVFTDPKIQQMLQQFVVLKADVTRQDQQDKQLSQHFNVIAPPTFIFFDNQGKLLNQYRLVGERNAKQFLARLEKVLAK